MKKQFAVIGLGRFGSSVVKTIYNFGFEVMAIDSSEQRVQNIINDVKHGVQVNATDEEALKALHIRDYDVVVVAIGQDIQASILTTLILKDMGVKNIIVKAQNDLHGKVLQKIGADKVIYPERDMGHRLAHHLISPNILDFIELSENYSIVEVQASEQMIGKSLSSLHIRAKYGCNVIAIKSKDNMNIAPRAEDVVEANDVLVIVGDNDHIKGFELSFQK